MTAAVSQWRTLAPWTDKKGRLSPLRAATLVALLLPAAWLALRWLVFGLGTRPVTVAIHSTGYAAIWILLVSLMVTPVKAISAIPNVGVIRRMTGVAALAYAVLHLCLYVVDQNYRPLAIVIEIATRFYLTIGFVALVGLVVLGSTSTDGAIRRMGPRWKRLHRIVYGIALLGAFHYFMQSKADVSQAVVAAGVFAWLMLWRRLPAGPDRHWAPLVGLALVAGLVTLGSEFLWYRFATKIDPWRVLAGEGVFSYGLRPAALVTAAGLLAAALAQVRRVSMTEWGARPGFTMAVYAIGAFVGEGAAFVFGLREEDAMQGWASLALLAAAACVFAAMGLARFRLRGTWHRHLVDGLAMAAAAYPLLLLDMDNWRLVVTAAILVSLAALLLTRRIWPVSRGAALMILPLTVWITLEAVTLLTP